MQTMLFSEISINCLCVYAFLNPAREDRVAEKHAITYRLMYLKSGRMNFQVKKETFVLSAGDVLFMPAGTKYSTVAFGKPVELYNILFNVTGGGQGHDNQLSRPCFSALNTRERVEFSDVKELNDCRVFKIPFIGEAFQEIAEEYARYGEFSQLIINAELTLLLLKLLKSNTRSSRGQQVDMIIKYINDNINTDISCGTVAAHFNYHPNYINKIMRLTTGSSLHSYIMNCKCKMAANMLLETDKSVTEIAHELYFCDSSHFSNVFSRIMKSSPSKYRKNFN